jgi:hypothetical protein
MSARTCGKQHRRVASTARVTSMKGDTMYRLGSLALACLLAACQRTPEATAPAELQVLHSTASHQDGGRHVSKDVARQIDRLREVTKRFKKFEAASAAGWGSKITDCFSDPKLGGMGFHYGNTALIDDKVDALKPELLLYEPRKNGKLEFVAVEYIVPFNVWTKPAPPSLYGLPFHRNEAFGLWVLHVWHEKRNPSGIFSDWNPRVSCKYAS